MTDSTRTIIDYAAADNGVGMRDALYAAIHDRVTAHIENKKQEMARSLISNEENVEIEAIDEPEGEEVDTEDEDEVGEEQ